MNPERRNWGSLGLDSIFGMVTLKKAGLCVHYVYVYGIYAMQSIGLMNGLFFTLRDSVASSDAEHVICSNGLLYRMDITPRKVWAPRDKGRLPCFPTTTPRDSPDQDRSVGGVQRMTALLIVNFMFSEEKCEEPACAWLELSPVLQSSRASLQNTLMNAMFIKTSSVTITFSKIPILGYCSFTDEDINILGGIRTSS